AENVQRWGHARMFTPFGLNRSPLGLAAIRAQDASWQSPGDDEFLTGTEYRNRYLIPLSQSDLLIDGLHERAKVIAVGRDGPRKSDLYQDEARGDWMFRLLIQHDDKRESTEYADIVIDTTGVYGNHSWLGQGGIPARGERSMESSIDHGLPDILGADRHRFADRHTLLVGNTFWAAHAAVEFSRLTEQSPATRLTWISGYTLDDEMPNTAESAVKEIIDAQAPERQRIIQAANRLASHRPNFLSYLPNTMVDAVQRIADGSFGVELVGQHAGQLQCDHIVNGVGYRPENGFL